MSEYKTYLLFKSLREKHPWSCEDSISVASDLRGSGADRSLESLHGTCPIGHSACPAPALWTRTCPRPSAPSEGGSWWTVARSPGLSVFPAPGTGWSVAHSCLRPTLDRNSSEKFLFRESWRDLPLAALRILATRRAAVGRSSVRYNYRLWAPASSGRIPLLKVPTNNLPGLRLTTETT